MELIGRSNANGRSSSIYNQWGQNMQHIWTILCQITSEDKNSSAFSLINVLDGISFSAGLDADDVDEVVIPLNFHIVTSWWQEELENSVDIDVQIRLMSPEGEDLGGPDLKLPLSESQFVRYNLNIQGFPYRGDGVYRYVVFQIKDGEQVEVQRIPIPVECIPFQEQQDSAAD